MLPDLIRPNLRLGAESPRRRRRSHGRRLGWGVLALAAALTSGSAAELFVSPDGNDAWSGRIATPNAVRNDGPLASLRGARDRVRRLKTAGALTEPVTITFAAGTYDFDKPIAFDRRDSGTKKTPILYRAAPGAKVTFTAGRVITGWRPVSDPATRNRLPEAARPHVRFADLRAQGVTDYGTLKVRGFGEPHAEAEAELFYDSEPMTLARWPNAGFRGIQARPDLQTVQVDTDRVSRWTAENDPWIFAYWHHDWAEVYEPIAGIDAARRLIHRSKDVKPRYGITPGRARWYAFNLLAELDAPGEYYLDRQNGRLYCWPPHPNGRAVLSLGEGFIRTKDLARVTFRGFTFEACRGQAITIDGGEDCHVVGCTIRDTGLEAVRVSGGSRHEVYGCDVYYTGEGGIFMSGGDRPSLTPAHHNAENNHVHHYARRARTYRPGIAVGGVGNRIAHNLIHDGPHMALSAGGNDHLLEFNEIHNVVEDSGDAGAYYVGRDWTQRGNVLRYNYWHDILGGTGYGGMTIYLDDQHCGHVIYGNLFERCSQTVFIGGGDDNVVTNNVFLSCWRAAHVDDRGMGWQKQATDDPNGTLRTRLRAMPYRSKLWRQRYPTLANILDDEPNIPKRNVFARNISAGGRWNHIYSSIRKYQIVQDNLVFDDDPAWARLLKDDSGQPVGLEFKDAAAVERIGFQPLPLKRMGVYADPRRASWPVSHTVRPVKLPDKP